MRFHQNIDDHQVDETKSQMSESNYSSNDFKQQKMLAKAIFDNIAETTDELAFKRGDILAVIEQDTDGLDGWWLCSLRGRQGICPGNRLKIIPSSYDSGCFSPSSTVSSPCPSIGSNTTYSGTGYPSELYENTSTSSIGSQKQGKRRSWHISPNKVVTPQKCGDVYLYDLLPNSNLNRSQYNAQSSEFESYDIPKPAVPINYDTPARLHNSGSIQFRTPSAQSQRSDFSLNSSRMAAEESYDIPKPLSVLSQQQNMTPSSSNSSLLTSDSLSLSSSNRSSLANMPDYDVPRRNPQSIRSTPTPPVPSHLLIQNQSLTTPTTTNTTTYDIPLSQSLLMQQTQLMANKELPLELSSALETLARLHNEATTAVKRLIAFVAPNWRSKDKLEPILMDLKLAAVRLRTALHDLAEFGDGALGNAAKADDKGLAIKLKPLVKALRDASKLIHEASHQLDMQGWTVDVLARSEQRSSAHQPQDSLDQLIACAQTLTEDVRQTASFIQGNATLLFKRSAQSSPSNNNSEWLEDYDYVSLESKEASAKKNAEIRDVLPTDLQKNFDTAIKNAETAVINHEKAAEMNTHDKSLIVYYASQTVTHMKYLTQAIDAFLQTVEHNQPPKFFIAYGKFVVLSAHNLINIGDIVHRNVSKQNVRARVLQCADALSEALKNCVSKTKKAAQHFPSVTAVQEMVDSVVDISHLASDLKIAMLQAVPQ